MKDNSGSDHLHLIHSSQSQVYQVDDDEHMLYYCMLLVGGQLELLGHKVGLLEVGHRVVVVDCGFEKMFRHSGDEKAAHKRKGSLQKMIFITLWTENDNHLEKK